MPRFQKWWCLGLSESSVTMFCPKVRLLKDSSEDSHSEVRENVPPCYSMCFQWHLYTWIFATNSLGTFTGFSQILIRLCMYGATSAAGLKWWNIYHKIFYTLYKEGTYSGNRNSGLEITILGFFRVSCLFTVLVENFFGLRLNWIWWSLISVWGQSWDCQRQGAKV